MLADGRIRPPRGHLWCEKLTEGKTLDVDGLGTISIATDPTPSGLVVVSGRTSEAEDVLTSLLVVRALGDDPLAWHTLYQDRERSWPLGTWAEQKVGRGTVLATRAIAGVDQGRDHHFVQVRFDEIAAIGAPLTEPSDLPLMYPGPGWLLVHMDWDESDDTSDGGIFIGHGAKDVYANSGLHWGTVYATPRGWDEPLLPGARVAVPRWNAPEYVELSGNIRAYPYYDILVHMEKG